MRLREPHLLDLKPQFDAIIERTRAAHELLSNAKSRRRYEKVMAAVQADENRGSKTARQKVDPAAVKAIVEANFVRARALVMEGEIHLAIKLLDHACKLEPRAKELVFLARLLLRNPQWTSRALAHLKHATEIDPFYSEAWIELAEYWRRHNQPSRQRQALEKALTADSDNERAQSMFRFLVGKREFQKYMNKLP